MFKINPLYYSDGYKVGHKDMLAPGTQYLYGTWIPRSTKHAPGGITKIVSFGQQLVWKFINDAFNEDFFYTKEREAYYHADMSGSHEAYKFFDRKARKSEALQFIKDMSLYLGLAYDGSHFEELWELGYLPIEVKALPEGVETAPNIPHMTFVNTVPGYAWLTLYLETIVSSIAWKPATSATIALQYRRNITEWVMKTDPDNAFLIPFLAHDFSARGLSPWDMISSGLGHATSFRGSDTLAVIPAARYYYNEPTSEVCINSVNASEHSVSTTKIFTVGERQMIIDWLKLLPEGIFSMVADTFSLWEFIEYLKDPEIKALVLSRNGKLVVRPDSGDPVDIICGIDPENVEGAKEYEMIQNPQPFHKGVIELLWDIFGGTTNAQGYKVLDPHIGAIYGDSINLDRQIQIYQRLEAKGFAATNIVLGVGSFTYQMTTRDSMGYAAKGGWFQVLNEDGTTSDYNIYKDPVTDDGTKKSPKGLLQVQEVLEQVNSDGRLKHSHYVLKDQCTWEEEKQGALKTIFKDGKLVNETDLATIRQRLNKL